VPDIRTEPLPATSALWAYHQDGDFIDGYAVQSTATVAEAAQSGFSLPLWAKSLMRLRNALVKPFGLRTELTPDEAASGPQGALFPVHLDTGDERILGTDDKHLNFRISIFRNKGQIHMATWVHPHNVWGRAYLAIVMPFHIAISRAALRRIARQHPPQAQ
jgi:hypothetical protein